MLVGFLYHSDKKMAHETCANAPNSLIVRLVAQYCIIKSQRCLYCGKVA